MLKPMCLCFYMFQEGCSIKIF